MVLYASVHILIELFYSKSGAERNFDFRKFNSSPLKSYSLELLSQTTVISTTLQYGPRTFGKGEGRCGRFDLGL
jgi:hypothetical protein